MPATRNGHVVLDYSHTPARFRCLHCGGEFILKLPAPITRMVKQSKAFEQLHADCEKGGESV